MNIQSCIREELQLPTKKRYVNEILKEYGYGTEFTETQKSGRDGPPHENTVLRVPARSTQVSHPSSRIRRMIGIHYDVL